MTTKTKNKTATRSQANKKSGGNGGRILLIVFGLIAVALIAAIVLSSNEPIGSAGEYGDPVISGDSLPAFDATSTLSADPAVGMVAPEVTGQDFSDNTVAINPNGTPTAVLFIAHWCPHCRAEVPRVQAWINSGGGVPGVNIISVTTAANSGQPNWPPSQWLKNEGWTQPNIRDDKNNSVFNAYGGGSFPFWVFLNGDGTVAARLAGETEVTTLQTVMESLQATR
jgi:thiol-disulfide isomerase/thioredoxin